MKLIEALKYYEEGKTIYSSNDPIEYSMSLIDGKVSYVLSKKELTENVWEVKRDKVKKWQWIYSVKDSNELYLTANKYEELPLRTVTIHTNNASKEPDLRVCYKVPESEEEFWE